MLSLIDPHCAYRPSRVFATLANHLSWLCSPEENTAKLQRDLGAAQQRCLLPGIKWTVKDARIDLFGYLPGVVLLNGLNYWPRPMPITFAAANEVLQRANEAFYRDPRTAPEYVLAGLGSIDSRAAAQDDALALRALLDNYHPAFTEPQGFLLLQKNHRPMQPRAEKTLLSVRKIHWTEDLPLGEQNDRMIWMEARIQPSFLGKLRALLYKPARCYLCTYFAGSTDYTRFPFITSMGPCGCLLSPFIQTNEELVKLYEAASGPKGLPRVEKIAFECRPGDEKYFNKEIEVRFYAVPKPAAAPLKEGA